MVKEVTEDLRPYNEFRLLLFAWPVLSSSTALESWREYSGEVESGTIYSPATARKSDGPSWYPLSIVITRLG